MTLAKRIYRCRDQHHHPFVDGVKHAHALIPTAGRFFVEPDIMAAVGRTDRTPLADLLRVLDRARPPFPRTWIEWSQPQGGEMGYLVEQADGIPGFAFRQFLYVHGMEQVSGWPLVCYLGRIVVDPSGYHCEHPAEAATTGTHAGENPHERAAADLISMFLMINSPSRVVKIDAEAAVSRVDLRREREGRWPLANLRRIRLDVAHLRRVDLDHGVGQADGRPRMEHFVRGHFKFRNGQMFWWSPHIRNQAGNDPVAQPRDYQVFQSEID